MLHSEHYTGKGDRKLFLIIHSTVLQSSKDSEMFHKFLRLYLSTHAIYVYMCVCKIYNFILDNYAKNPHEHFLNHLYKQFKSSVTKQFL